MVNRKDAEKVIADFQQLLDQTPTAAYHVRIGEGAWTLAEIVGHLIDSASNNHQRFARLRFGNLINFPGYDAEPWVAAQRYDACSFAMLTAVWASYNELLLHLACSIPQEVAGNVWSRSGESTSHEEIAEDYYAHLRKHIDHYRTRLEEVLEKIGAA